MTNYIDPRNATQMKYEHSSSTFTLAFLFITMQKGSSCFHIVINNLIVFQE